MRPARSWRYRALAIVLAVAAHDAWAAQVRNVSPQNSARDVRQITIAFDSDMVPLGDPRIADPAVVECGGAPGQGRWVDGRHWAYDFPAPLPAGLRCQVQLKPDLKAVDGSPLSGRREFAFDTGGPAIRDSLPSEGESQIDAEQVFMLVLDAPATPASVQAHTWCAAENLAERLPVTVLEGEARQQVLDNRAKLGYRYRRLLRGGDGESSWEPLADDEAAQREQNLVLLRCARPLPEQTAVDLVWGAGIESPGGVATRHDQVLKFTTRASFTASFSCSRTNPQAACIPVLPMTLQFSAPVATEIALRARLEGAGFSLAPTAENDSPFVQRLTFAAPLPEDAKLQLRLPDGLTDDAGRELANASRFPLDVTTESAPPLVKFSGEFGILESRLGGVLPVTLRAVEAVVPAQRIGGQSLRIDDEAEVIGWMKRVRAAMNPRWEGDGMIQPGVDSVFSAHSGTAFEITRPEGGKSFEVIGIPLRDPGFYVVELASPQLGAALLGAGKTRYVATIALVTNLAVHFKWGREGSLVFVTALDTGKPVAGADISVVDGCNAQPIARGRTDDHGLLSFPEGLPAPASWSNCDSSDNGDSHPLMISARHDGDFSFALSNWNDGIQPYDFNLNVGLWSAPTIGHSVLDRSLFRAGETVSMKHYWRQHNANGLRVPERRPDKLVIEHIGGEQRAELPLSFDANGIATNEWPIPAGAALGEYRLHFEGADNLYVDSGSFRVEQYRRPLMRALIEPPPQAAIAVDSLPLNLYVGYLAGGGAADLGVKLRSQVQSRSVGFSGYEDYSFNGEPIVEGIVDNDTASDRDVSTPSPSRVQPVTLDAQGAARVSIDALPAAETAQTLVTELEYPDANGQVASVRQSVTLWPASVAVGIGSTRWTRAGEPLRVQTVVLDTQGKPVAHRSVEIKLYERKMHSYRKRLVGGFYTYSSSTETRRLDVGCKGRSDAQGRFSCDIEDKALRGSLSIEAVVRDEQGRRARATGYAWISGSDDDWFAQGDSDRMDVIPQQRQVEPGQTLKLQVRSPFRHATALVSVEREGVLDAFVTDISGRDPVISVPMLDRYAPNVYVSVLAVRPRVSGFRSRLASFLRWAGLDRWLDLEGGSPTALVDLSKPAYRLGIAAVDVGWNAHRLNVQVTPQQTQYETRQKVLVDIAVKTADGSALPAGAEIAFSAVDEALLELLPNESVNLLDAMMQRRGIEVLTATAQMQVVGKRHYGRKSAPPGGGGGRGAPREMLNSLLSWQARVALDADGKAQLEVPLNDALSEFRFTAVASAGLDRFGEGHARVRTTQDVQLLSGLPPLVRGGDAYQAALTLRNTGDQARNITLSAKLRDATGHEWPSPESKTLSLPAQSAQTVSFDTVAPLIEGSLSWTLEAQDDQGKRLDALRVEQRVVAAVPVRVQQATLMQLDKPQQLDVAMPGDAEAGRGGIRVALSSSLAANLDGVREWMQVYPYSCNEQRASRAVALDRPQDWASLMNALPAAIDSDGLLKYFAAPQLDGSDVLTSYLIQLADSRGWSIPDATLERLLNGLSRFAEGRIQREGMIGNSTLIPRRLAAIEALSRHERARAEWLESMPFDPSLLGTSALVDWIGILQRLESVPERDAKLSEANSLLRARLDLSGTKLSLSGRSDDAWWLMDSVETSANRAILALMDDADWRAEMPRLVRGSVGLQQRGHWGLTTANAWGTIALQRFAAEFERGAVSGTTTAVLGDERVGSEWNQQSASAIDLPWPSGESALALRHDGSGAPWAVVQSRAAVAPKTAFSAGYRIERTITPVEQKTAGQWSVGDVARVHIEVGAASDMGWVVIDDPIPAGASVIGNLGRDSALLTQGERSSGFVWPAFEERRFDAYRAYYEYVPQGRFSTEYTLRFNTPGRFEMPATRVEAMYAPEMFGELPNETVEIRR